MGNSNDSGFTQGLILGAFIGSTVGALTALLLAPKTGSELRKDIASKSQEFYDRTSDYIYSAESNLGSAINSTVNEGRVRAQNIIDSAKHQAEDILATAENILKDAKGKAVSAKDGIQDKISNLRDAAKAGAETFKNEIKFSDSDELDDGK